MFLWVRVLVLEQFSQDQFVLPSRTSGPALAGGERAAVGPAHGVLTRSTVCVGHTASSIGPERVEVAVASSLLARSDASSLLHITGKREGADCCASCDEKALE